MSILNTAEKIYVRLTVCDNADTVIKSRIA